MAAREDLEILGLDHVVLRVQDRDRSLAFYCDLLGCELERELPELGLIQLRAGRSLIDLALVDSPIGRAGGPAAGEKGHNMDHFALQTRIDEPALRARLEAAGVEVSESGDRYGSDGVARSIYLGDPDGNTVELRAAGDGRVWKAGRPPE